MGQLPDQDRTDFEKTVRAQWPSLVPLFQESTGRYFDTKLRKLFWLWQAAQLAATTRLLAQTPQDSTSDVSSSKELLRNQALLICAESAALCGNEREVGCPRCDAVLAMAAHFCFTAEDLSALFTPDHVAEGQRQEADGGATHLSKDM